MRSRITKRDISRLTAGTIPRAMNGKPFIVIRYSEKLPFSDHVSWTYAIVTDPCFPNGTTITRDKAIRIIDNFGMTEAVRGIHGRIYEMSGKPFLNKHKRPF